MRYRDQETYQAEHTQYVLLCLGAFFYFCKMYPAFLCCDKRKGLFLSEIKYFMEDIDQ